MTVVTGSVRVGTQVLNPTAVITLPAATTGILVGASVNPKAYNASGYVQAAGIWDGFVGRPCALTVQKWYPPTGSIPTSVPSEMKALAARGCKFLVCLDPPHTIPNAGQLAATQTFCSLMAAAGIEWRAIMCNEANIGSKFTSAAEYQAWVNYYAPAISVPVIYNPAVTNINDGAAYGADASGHLISAFSGVIPDIYCSAFHAGQRLDAVAALNGTLAGIGEFGGSATPSYTCNITDWTNFINYLIGFGQWTPDAWLVYFNGVSQPNNTLADGTDFKITGLRLLVDTL